MDKQLSKNFKLSEFTRSNTAIKQKIDNSIPNGALIQNLTVLVTDVMQPIRELVGSAVKVTSGYRKEALNKLVGGADSSQHQICEACDFTVPGQDLRTIYEKIKASSIPFDQLILEIRNGVPQWIHISYKRPSQRVAFEKSVK